MATRLGVWRDSYRGYRLVGHLEQPDGDPARTSFSYHVSYLQGSDSTAIFRQLPLTATPYEGRLVRACFGALVARTPAADHLARRLQLDPRALVPRLARLGDETPGDLVFGDCEVSPGAYEGYRPLDARFLEDFARKPRAVATQTAVRARQSLPGSTPKIALYLDEARKRWLMPVGCAPSTHVAKACPEGREGQTLAEALCLKAAELCDIVAVRATLVDAGASEPLLVSCRYDRARATRERAVSGCPRPARLHQEGFCQALGIPDFLRREPGETDYLGNVATCASRACDNGFGARCALFESLVFGYLLGDCDNDLQHYSLLYGAGGSATSCEIAPVCGPQGTGVNHDPTRAMGVALSRTRRLDDVSRSEIRASMRRAGVPQDMGEAIVGNLSQRLPGALEQARDHYLSSGFAGARPVADLLIAGARARIEAIRISHGT